MTMRPRDLTEMPADTATVGRQVLPATNPYRVLGDRLAELIADTEFAALYEPTGRTALSPALLALVTLFQFLEDVPDREAATLVAVRLDWKYALHLPLAYAGFDFSCLCYFRQRLLAHQQERLLFDTILQRVQALGFLTKRGKQRTDSLAVVGAVRQLSQLETVTETLRVTVRALEQADAAWTARAVPASFREQYARRQPDYRLSAAERQAALEHAGADGYWLLDRLATDAPAAVRGLAAGGTLQTVWEQRYERTAGLVTVRERTVDGKQLIISPHDPGVRAGEKRGQHWLGEKVHVTETAEPGGPNFLTDVTTANAASGDGEARPTIRGRLAERHLTPTEQVVDAGYISGKQLAESQAAGMTLLGPPLEDTSRQAFKLAAFQIDRGAQQATCPGGHAAVKWSPRTDRDGSPAVNIQFAAATCQACPLRPQCTTSQSGRSLHLSAHYELLEARRAEAQTAAFREQMRARPAIEATLSELVRQHGLRRHRYRGEAPRALENLLKGAACNLKRLLRAVATRPQASGQQMAAASSP